MPSTSEHSHKSQSGFTLIEMMIVVAIISILAAIGIVSYQNYIRKTQVMTVYKDINHFRIPYHILVNEGVGTTEFSPSGFNMLAQTGYCQFSVVEPSAARVTPDAVRCDIHGLPYLQNQYISLDYDIEGSWQCRASTGISKAYLPQACQ